MSFESSRYSSDGNGFIYAPSEGFAPPSLSEASFETIHEQLLVAPNDSSVAGLYEDLVLGLDKGSRGLVELAIARRIFQSKVEQDPSERIPIAIAMKNKDIVRAIVMRLDGSKGARHRMQIERRQGPRLPKIPVDRSLTLNLGMLPMNGDEVSLCMSAGVVLPVAPGSDWSESALIDFVGYVREGESYVPSKRFTSVVAIGNMVEPLLTENGMSDLYEAWQQLPNPLVQRQIMRIGKER